LLDERVEIRCQYRVESNPTKDRMSGRQRGFGIEKDAPQISIEGLLMTVQNADEIIGNSSGLLLCKCSSQRLGVSRVDQLFLNGPFKKPADKWSPRWESGRRAQAGSDIENAFACCARRN